MREVDVYRRPTAGLDAKSHHPQSGERGSVSMKTILWLAIMGCFIYVCVQAGPYFVSEYEFQDSIQTIARFASVNRMSSDDLRASVMKEATKDDIPVRPQDIKVSAVSGNVRIEAAYSVIVDLRVYQWNVAFHPSATNNALF